VGFAPLDLLAGVVIHLIVDTAPFPPILTDWLSRTAAERLASRPIGSRNIMRGSTQIASRTPSRWNLRKMLSTVERGGKHRAADSARGSPRDSAGS
jgi:hypothetical protein